MFRNRILRHNTVSVIWRYSCASAMVYHIFSSWFIALPRDLVFTKPFFAIIRSLIVKLFYNYKCRRDVVLGAFYAHFIVSKSMAFSDTMLMELPASSTASRSLSGDHTFRCGSSLKLCGSDLRVPERG